MSWFRFYTEALNDPKVQRLPGEVFKCWVNLLCLAKDREGHIPSTKDCAFALRVTEKKAKKFLDALTDAGLIHEVQDGYEPHNWAGRQYKSDNSTERVRRHRERQCNVSETPPESETETETEKTPPKSPQGDGERVSPKPRKKKKKGPREYDAEFLAWWEKYPRHEAKGDAFDAYWAMREGHDRDTLLAGASWAAKKYADTEAQYIPLPATFLRGERYLAATEGASSREPPPGVDPVEWYANLGENDALN